jgi:hypothetical protein
MASVGNPVDVVIAQCVGSNIVLQHPGALLLIFSG